MAPPTAIAIYAHTLTPFLRLPLLLTDIIALPLVVVSMNIPGIVFICLSLPFATIDFLIWLKRWRSHRIPIEEKPISVSKFCILFDLMMGIGMLITWIISLVENLSHSWYYENEGLIACFALFMAWMLHTLHLLFSLYLWTWMPKRQAACYHCGHCPNSVPIPAALGRDSDERTAYDEDAEQDAEDAALLKVDAEA